MSDNLGYTPGSGALVSTDQLAGGEHVQFVKLMDGTLNGEGKVAADATYGLDVDVTRQPPPNVFDLTLSLDTAAYAVGDVLADSQEITNFFPVATTAVKIASIVVLDEDDQGGAFDILFLDSNVSIGSENAAISVSDANARKIVGHISVVGADYIDLGGSRLATIDGRNLIIKAASGATSIYIACLSQDTKTYTASGLKLKIGIELH